MKRGVPAYTIRQVPQVHEVLEQRASEKGVDLTVVDRLSSLEDVKLGLEGDFQIDNASLAVTIAASHLRKLGIKQEQLESIDRVSLPGKFVTGLESVVWAGRCQVREDGKITWFLDGAHTENSLHMSYATIEEAVELARRVSEGDERLFVFVTGSLYLVGGYWKFLNIRRPNQRDSVEDR